MAHKDEMSIDQNIAFGYNWTPCLSVMRCSLSVESAYAQDATLSASDRLVNHKTRSSTKDAQNVPVAEAALANILRRPVPFSSPALSPVDADWSRSIVPEGLETSGLYSVSSSSTNLEAISSRGKTSSVSLSDPLGTNLLDLIMLSRISFPHTVTSKAVGR
jgi:hypothetical protein